MQGRNRQVEACLPRPKRCKEKKERDRAEKCKPNRISFDLPADLPKKRLAKKDGAPIHNLGVS